MSIIEKKIEDLIRLFASQESEETKFGLLVSIGKKLAPLSPQAKTENNLIKGCQNQIYIHTYLQEGLMRIQAESDALIPAGLASLLIQIFDNETPETILKTPFDFFNKLGLKTILSPNRSNGFYNMYLKIKQDALKFLKK